MSEEATRAVVTRWFDALDAGDVDAAMACLDDNVRWINSPAEEGKPGGIPGLSAIIPWLGDFSNKADVIATFGPWGERQETVQYERLNMMFKDDQALVLVHEAARIRATGLIIRHRVRSTHSGCRRFDRHAEGILGHVPGRRGIPRGHAGTGIGAQQSRATPTKPNSSCRLGRTRTRPIPVSAGHRPDDCRGRWARRDGEDAPFVRRGTKPGQSQIRQHRASQRMPNRQGGRGESTCGRRRSCQSPAPHNR